MKSAMLLFLAALSLSICGTIGQEFHFDKGIQLNNTCGLNQRTMWSSEGSITLTPGDLVGFDPKVVIRANHDLCTVDLTECPPKVITKAYDSCYCKSRSKDQYNIYVGATATLAHSGMTLQAVVPGRGALKNIYGAVEIGVLPNVTDVQQLDASFTIDDGKPRALLDEQTITVCPEQWFRLEICVKNKASDAEMKITTDSRINVAVGSCIVISHKFTLEESRTMTFSYKEPTCTHLKKLSFMEDGHACYPSKTALIEIDGVCPSTPRQVMTHPWGSTHVLDTVSFNSSWISPWIVFQRRTSGSVDFNTNWSNYVTGFGDVTTNFWLGLKELHTICNLKFKCELLVNLLYPGEPQNGAPKQPDGCYFARYEEFWIGSEAENFKLSVSGHSGTAEDSLTGSSYVGRRANNMGFTTFDVDNDLYSGNCASEWGSGGGWWFNRCMRANLNGKWGSSKGGEGIIWYSLTGDNNPLHFSEMKARRLM